MKRTAFVVLLAVLLATVCLAQPAAAGTKEQLIQLQTTVQILQDKMDSMQQALGRRMGTIGDSLSQQIDKMDKMDRSFEGLQMTLAAQNKDCLARTDQITGQVQSLHDSMDELKTRLSRLGKQLDDIQAAQQNIGGDRTPAPGAGKVPPGSPPPLK
ncbi:MAG TPA: hypothetical protein VKW06_12345 [Candidatus Angelobacter sp.]|nr:hypothetical protein [Candidatus Angelobacter sp.]